MSQAGSFGGGGGGATVNTLTGNTGGPISPVAGNINVVGDGTTVTVAGAGNTLTISMAPNASAIVHYTNINTSPYVATTTLFYLSVDTSVIPITIQLPNTPPNGRFWVIKDRAGNAEINNITITTPGGLDTIDGVISYIINTNYQSTNILYNGANYEIW